MGIALAPKASKALQIKLAHRGGIFGFFAV